LKRRVSLTKKYQQRRMTGKRMDCCLRLGWEESDKHGGWTIFKSLGSRKSRDYEDAFFLPGAHIEQYETNSEMRLRGDRGQQRRAPVKTKRVNPREKYQFWTDTYVWRKWFRVSTGTWHIKYGILRQPLRKW
jgi:hypothetical protein